MEGVTMKKMCTQNRQGRRLLHAIAVSKWMLDFPKKQTFDASQPTWVTDVEPDNGSTWPANLRAEEGATLSAPHQVMT
jgi:hypothetical protein